MSKHRGVAKERVRLFPDRQSFCIWSDQLAGRSAGRKDFMVGSYDLDWIALNICLSVVSYWRSGTWASPVPEKMAMARARETDDRRENLTELREKDDIY
jgi:hypothetical protein